VKVNVPARIYQSYGRQLTIEGADGSRSMAAMFDIMGRLYQIEAKVPRGGSEFELTRFQQSWYSIAASRTARPSKSAPFARAVPAWSVFSTAWAIPLTPQGWTIHAAKPSDEKLDERSRPASNRDIPRPCATRMGAIGSRPVSCPGMMAAQ
jgi:hypothetical protein